MIDTSGAPGASAELTGPAFFEDPYPVYARLRATREPMFNETTRAWVVSRFADVESVLRDPRISKKIQRETATSFETSVLFRDPPDHGRIRGLLNQVFAAMPEDLDRRVERIADGLIERMLAEGNRADFMRDFALPLPVAVIGEVLGIPAGDMSRLHGWSSEFILDEGVSQGDMEMRQYAAICGMDAYFRGLIAARQPDGMIGAMLKADPSGDRLTADELIGNCILLLVAGHETTVNLLGNGLYLMLKTPGCVERIRRDARLLGTAMEEILRFESPVQQGTFRVLAEEVEIGGKKLAAGSFVTALIGAANRDPEVFAEADVFDVGRAANRHLAFGFGPHRCIGAQLARAEGRVGFSRLLERMPNLALDAEPRSWMQSLLGRAGLAPAPRARAPQWRHTAVTRGLKELRIAF